MLDADRLARVQKFRKGVLLAVACVGALLLIPSDPIWSHFTRRLIETVGLLFICICIVGRTLCSAYISGRKNAAIVDAGPYSVCRNPLYMFSLIGVTGIGLVTGSLVFAALFGTVIWLIQRVVVEKEEAFLRLTHGRQYEAYLRRVPRFWPDFSLWQGGDHFVINAKGVLTTFLDASLFLLAIPIAECLEYLKATKLIPVLWGVP